MTDRTHIVDAALNKTINRVVQDSLGHVILLDAAGDVILQFRENAAVFDAEGNFFDTNNLPTQKGEQL